MLTTQRYLAPLLALSMVALVAPSARAQAQSARVTSATRMATREALGAAAEEYDRLAASTAYGEALRARARTEAAAVRRRLTEGDFHVGDRLLVRVEGAVMLDDTITVMDGQRITVRGIRQVALAGVLRAELEASLRAEINEVVQRVTVSASPLLRVAVLGSVVRPSFLSVPETTTLDRLITLAGGPVANAALTKITVQRADTVVVQAADIQRAMASGATVEAIGLLDGDIVNVPLQSPPWERAQTIQLITTVLFPILTLVLVRR